MQTWSAKIAAPQEYRIQPPTFAEAGVDKKLSARAQKLAAVPEGLAIPYASRK